MSAKQHFLHLSLRVESIDFNFTAYYGSLFPPLDKKTNYKKKGYCDFLSHNCKIKSQNCEKKVRIAIYKFAIASYKVRITRKV